MNVILRGRVRQILESMIAEGYANTKSEAIRLAILNFRKGNLNEKELVKKKLDWIDNEIKAGRRKVLTAKEVFGHDIKPSR